MLSCLVTTVWMRDRVPYPLGITPKQWPGTLISSGNGDRISFSSKISLSQCLPWCHVLIRHPSKSIVHAIALGCVVNPHGYPQAVVGAIWNVVSGGCGSALGGCQVFLLGGNGRSSWWSLQKTWKLFCPCLLFYFYYYYHWSPANPAVPPWDRQCWLL